MYARYIRILNQSNQYLNIYFEFYHIILWYTHTLILFIIQSYLFNFLKIETHRFDFKPRRGSCVEIFASQFSSYYVALTERASHTSRINLTNNVIGACTSGHQEPRCGIQPANHSGMCVSLCYRLLAETMRESSRKRTSICTYLLVCTSSLPISWVYAGASVHKRIRQSFRYPCLYMR